MCVCVCVCMCVCVVTVLKTKETLFEIRVSLFLHWL